MKKSFILLAAAVLTSSIAMSQDDVQDLKKNYVRLQYVAPIGAYSDFFSSGIGAEYGRHFYFNTMWFDCITPGIDITFAEVALNFGNRYNYNEQGDILNGMMTRKGVNCFFYSDGGFLSTVGVKLGPVFTYNIVDDLFADFYIKYAPSFIWGSRSLNFVDMTDAHRAIEDMSSMYAGFAHRLSTGLNIKYRFFTFGIEFLFGKTTMNFSKEIVPQAIDPIPNNGSDTWRLTDEKKLGLNTFKITIGYLF
ncbi:MAG: hypothetical protein LBO06_00640 [Bacteroidales bacterium]|jgi:hypothetical protein|nr:hypothetical protein [Bacteroidales bacterium]